MALQKCPPLSLPRQGLRDPDHLPPHPCCSLGLSCLFRITVGNENNHNRNVMPACCGEKVNTLQNGLSVAHAYKRRTNINLVLSLCLLLHLSIVHDKTRPLSPPPRFFSSRNQPKPKPKPAPLIIKLFKKKLTCYSTSATVCLI